MDGQQQHVLRTLEERDIHYVRLWFTDVLGYLKSVAVAPAELESAFSAGIGFDGSAIEGFARVHESDMIARPDASTFQVLPWATGDGKPHSARMFCDIAMPDGTPSWADPRHVLRRVTGEAAAMGFSCYVHPEVEFFLLKNMPEDGSEPEPADRGGFFDQATYDAAPEFRRQAIESLESMGISVEFSHHEGAPGQQEIDLRYAEAIDMADNIMSLRYAVKEVARTQGVHASFMPKPFPQYPGSALHTHFSLFEGETNAFHDPGQPNQMSATGQAFVAGVLRHAPELTAVCCQFVNSYKRLVMGEEAPTAVSWGQANRSALIRVPNYSPQRSTSQRMEIRLPDSACNPYLMIAVVLAAGLEGIRQGYELPPEAEEDVSFLTPAERKALGYADLPLSLGSALAVMESSDLVAHALGEHVFEFFLRNKAAEWETYRRQVTFFERQRYLSL
ncbi:MAG: glutamine synthetase [Actinobacteria bacterium 69-20]|nr:glutamine synthetase [Actinomycetota bacterium]OJV25262.1 MAG: glutamine synthetase [Actinobacteria bacterium 69-20]